ncbi:iron ABC transporter permease [Ureibacillus sp. Re31]|uniref:Iron ABC transporter permease n=1 Tax=Ureibacillus galli TaxID=2762222 RepID=A0ABR8XES0_9BACL|nr:iron ABC transporter permease [Ureibacillus galli]MBD8027738.1 iron ABC transporter permease [Ureibacillus galli]
MKSSYKISFFVKLFIAVCILFVIAFLAITNGAAHTTLQDVWNAMVAKEGGQYYSELREIRFPRAIAAFFVGSALAVAGAIMQGMTRNPIADPGLLGLTSGANMMLAITLAFIPGASNLMIMFTCFIGAAIGMVIVYGIGMSTRGGLSPMKLVLAGAAVTAFLQAIADGVGILFDISKDVSMWTAGGLVGTTWTSLIIVPFIVFGLLFAILISRQLTILSLNEEVAVGLGQNTILIKTIMMVVVVILAGGAVALIGNLAFVGLIIPHIVRAVVGHDYRLIIPMSIIVGGAFMTLADFVSRVINAPFETPTVSLIALIGLPFFLVLVRKGGRVNG